MSEIEGGGDADGVKDAWIEDFIDLELSTQDDGLDMASDSDAEAEFMSAFGESYEDLRALATFETPYVPVQVEQETLSDLLDEVDEAAAAEDWTTGLDKLNEAIDQGDEVRLALEIAQKPGQVFS